MSNQTRRIQISVNTAGAKEVEVAANRLGLLNKNVKSLTTGMNVLSGAFSGWLGFLGVSQLTRMSDEMQNIGNRLKIITGSTSGAAAAFEQLAGVADRTNQGIGQTGEVFSRLAISLKGAKVGTAEALAITETLINTFRVAGATTAETTNTIIQLSQAFASGELRGQELRSVMEQNATLATILRERLGPDIYEKAKKGLIGVSTVLRLLAENQARVNEQAALLAPTFEQTVTKAMNKVQIKIKELNEEYQISIKFAILMRVFVDNLGTNMSLLAAVAVPALVASLGSLFKTMLLFAANPVALALAGITLAVGSVISNFDKWESILKRTRATMYDWLATFREIQLGFREWTGATKTPDAMKAVDETRRQIMDARKAARDLRQEIANDILTKDNKIKSVAGVGDDEQQKLIKSAADKLDLYGKKGSGVEKVKDLLGGLNKELLKTKDVEAYTNKLNDLNLKKLTDDFKKGGKDIFTFAEGLKQLQVEKLNRELARGTITLNEYKSSVDNMNLTLLNEKMQAGLITMKDYNNELLKMETKFSESSPFKTGVTNYMESVGTLAENIAKGVERTFGALEDGLVQFVKTGKINFKDFANAVIEEIIRIQVRMALAGLISSIIGGATTATAGSYSGGTAGSSFGNNYNLDMPAAPSFATGGIMTASGPMPLNRYASGGIARSPQMAMFGEGRMPEAYVPLPNGRSIPVEMNGAGNSVSVMVNVNQSTGSSDVQSDSAFGRKLGDAIQAAVRKELVENRRPGGYLT